jgi:tetratricopeptide (TPR) repeat protein
MLEREEPPSQYAWIVYAIALMLFGGLTGYIIAVSGARAAGEPAATATTVPIAAPSSPVIEDAQLRAYRDILARDPKNLQAAVGAGNLLYDAQRYHEAIGFYSQAHALNPSDVNVSTDLGTALWYSGRVDEALAQYARSLAINPTHSQTLFNLGIVRADGKHDHGGAIAAWQKLLETAPDYPAAERVRSRIADARTKL